MRGWWETSVTLSSVVLLTHRRFSDEHDDADADDDADDDDDDDDDGQCCLRCRRPRTVDTDEFLTALWSRWLRVRGLRSL